jgi:hypothetical protein
VAKQTFTTGSVLTAAQMNTLQANDYNQTVSQKTASYVLVAADAGTRIEMNAAGATTVTVNTGLFTAGDTLFIQNIGAGACTVTAGTATVNKATGGSLTLSQYQGGTLYFVSASSAIFFADAGYTPPLTTKGDLFGFDTAAARIPIGTNNQVLTADSTQALGLKWASPTTTLSGVWAYASAGTTVTSATNTVIAFAAEVYDTDGYHDNVTNNSRITIPAGLGGKFLVSALISFPGNVSGSRLLAINKNGSTGNDFCIQLPTSSVNENFTITYTNVISLAAADYITLTAYQTSGSTLTTRSGDPTAGNISTWLSVNRLGA